MYKAILFDLDGTLTDSGEGIMKSVQYALEKIGHPEPDYTNLRSFVGPPLAAQFMQYAGIDEETAGLAVKYYRERYAPVGIFENEVYDGVEDMLRRLSRKGYRLGVASSKPEPFVNKVLEHFGILKYFEAVVGSTMDGARSAKSEVIEEALVRLGLEEERESVALVGDKNYDVFGAREAGMECLAVSYGYGSVEELRDASPLKIVSSPEEVVYFFRQTALRAENPLYRLWRILYPIGMHFGISILVTLGASVFAEILAGAAIAYGNMGGTIEEHVYEMVNRNAILLTGITAVLTLIPCIFFYMKDRKRREYGRLVPTPAGTKLRFGTVILMLLAGAALALLGNILVSVVMELLPPSWNIDVLAEAEEGQPLWWLILWVGIAAPLAEEAVFRWLVYLRLRDHRRIWSSVFLSALLFGAYHLNVPQGIYAGLLGIFFAYFLEMTGNIWTSVLLHAGANIASLFMQEAGKYAGADDRSLTLYGSILLGLTALSLVYTICMTVHEKRTGAARGYRAI